MFICTTIKSTLNKIKSMCQSFNKDGPVFYDKNFLSIHCSKEVVTIDFVIEPTLPKRNSVNNA